MLCTLLLLPHFTTSKGRAWREYLRRRVWEKSLHISMPSICMETLSGHEHDLWVSLPSWEQRPFPHGGVQALELGLLETWEESGGFSTELSLASDLVAWDRGLQHFLEGVSSISLKRGGITLDFWFIQHIIQLFRQPLCNGTFHG